MFVICSIIFRRSKEKEVKRRDFEVNPCEKMYLFLMGSRQKWKEIIVELPLLLLVEYPFKPLILQRVAENCSIMLLLPLPCFWGERVMA